MKKNLFFKSDLTMVAVDITTLSFYSIEEIDEIFNEAIKEDDFNIVFSLPSAASSVWVDVYYFPILSTAL